MCSRGPWRRQPGTVVSNRSTAILIKTHTVAREDVTAAVETRALVSTAAVTSSRATVCVLMRIAVERLLTTVPGWRRQGPRLHISACSCLRWPE